MDEPQAPALGPHTVGALRFELFGPDGELLEANTAEAPLRFLFGSGALVPGLERALLGRRQGESLQVQVAPEEGYGLPDPRRVYYVPRDQFPEGTLEPGAMMGATTAEGEEVTFWITAVEDERVVVNENHPLAGVPLDYRVEVLGVRAASDEERAAGRLLEPSEGA